MISNPTPAGTKEKQGMGWAEEGWGGRGGRVCVCVKRNQPGRTLPSGVAKKEAPQGLATKANVGMVGASLFSLPRQVNKTKRETNCITVKNDIIRASNQDGQTYH